MNLYIFIMNNDVVFALIVLGFLFVQYIYIIVRVLVRVLTARDFNKRQKENEKQRENNSRDKSKEY